MRFGVLFNVALSALRKQAHSPAVMRPWRGIGVVFLVSLLLSVPLGQMISMPMARTALPGSAEDKFGGGSVLDVLAASGRGGRIWRVAERSSADFARTRGSGHYDGCRNPVANPDAGVIASSGILSFRL